MQINSGTDVKFPDGKIESILSRIPPNREFKFYSCAAIVDSSSNHTLSLPQSSSTYPTASNESDPYKEDLGISHVAKMILMNDRIISDVSLPIHFQCIAEV